MQRKGLTYDFRDVARMHHFGGDECEELWAELILQPCLARGVDFLTITRDGQQIRLLTKRADRILSSFRDSRRISELIEFHRSEPDRPMNADGGDPLSERGHFDPFNW